MKKHIIVITTGGTIAMKQDKKTGGLIPAVSGTDLMEAVPDIATWADIDVVEFSNIPSGWMTLDHMARLSRLIEELAKKENVDGFVVTHGTDTLEETAYFLDISLQTEKPVCITGAMRGAGEKGSDGAINILSAIRVAADDQTKGMGVTVCLNETIYAARSVTKGHTTHVNTFQDGNYGPLGYVYRKEIHYGRRPLSQKKVKTTAPEEDVWILPAWSGMNEKSIDAAMKEAKGVIIEGLGCGNVPPLCKKGILRLRKAGIPVILTTSVPTGAIQEEYSYDGSLRSMRDAGVISGGDLSPKKARIALALLLGHTRNTEEIRSYFEGK